MGGKFSRREPVPLRPERVSLGELLTRAEDDRVEWKLTTSGFRSEYLVAFANSDLGGTMLFGVDDDGVLRGERLSDDFRNTVGTAASQCIPTIEYHLSEQSHSGVRLVRLDIPPSFGRRPHCTSGGRYKVRGNGQLRTLTPPELLEMFLEREGNKFEERFRAATDRAIEDLHRAARGLDARIAEILDMAGPARAVHLHARK